MSLLPSHRIGLMYDRAPIRDPVACEQPFGGRGGELSPHSPCSCAGDLELKAEGVGWSAVWLKVYDIRKKTLNVIRGSKIES